MIKLIISYTRKNNKYIVNPAKRSENYGKIHLTIYSSIYSQFTRVQGHVIAKENSFKNL